MSAAMAHACESRPLTIYLVAAEESGDRLGGALMRALAQRAGRDVRFGGVGGRDMASAGLASLFPIDELGDIGVVALARRVPMILGRIRQAAAAIVAAQPDALVIIDSPDFTHRVARRVRKAAPSIPIIDYVSPSVWAWRPWRARTMRAYVDEVLAILPFEVQAHAELGGPPCVYVGHPLIEQLDQLRPNPADARRRLADPPILLVLPGSRPSEVRRLIETFGETVRRLTECAGPVELVLPTVPALVERLHEITRGWAIVPRVTADQAEKAVAFRTARAALAASGTVTLELALAEVPTVAAYRIARFEEAIALMLLRVPSVILPNLVLGANVVPEFLQDRCTPQNLAAALLPLLADTPERRGQLEAFTRFDAAMRVDVSPSAKAAEAVLSAIAARASDEPRWSP